MEFRIELELEKGLENVYLVAGLPGMGLSGKQAVDHLIKVLDVEKVSHIETPFLNPPGITTVNGVVEDMLTEVFNFFHAEKDGKNLIIFTGEVQPMSPEWQHIMSRAVVESVKEFDVKAVFTLAATPIESYKYDVDVYGVATSKQFLSELVTYGVVPMAGQGAISGMNGLIIGYAKMYGLRGASLLAETYLKSAQDFIAPYALLRMLSKILKIDVDLKELEERRQMFHQEYLRHLREAEREDKSGLGYIS